MKIDTYYSNITKIAGLLRNDHNLAGNQVIPVLVGNKNDINIITEFRISKNFSNFDCDVADAIYTIYQNGYGSFTPGQILRVLSGDDKQTIVKGYNKKRIIDSINLLRSTMIEIDCSQEMQSRGIKVEHIGEASFLAVEKIIKNDKYEMQLRENYSIVKTEKYADFFMPLYGYAEMLHQFCSFHKPLLYSESAAERLRISNTIENIQIKRYLIRRLDKVRNANQRYWDAKDGTRLLHPAAYKSACLFKDFTTIIYERESHNAGGGTVGMLASLGIYKREDGTKDAWRHKRHKVHHIVLQFLEYYKEIGYIKSYEVINGEKDARLIRGVTVHI